MQPSQYIDHRPPPPKVSQPKPIAYTALCFGTLSAFLPDAIDFPTICFPVLIVCGVVGLFLAGLSFVYEGFSWVMAAAAVLALWGTLIGYNAWQDYVDAFRQLEGLGLDVSS